MTRIATAYSSSTTDFCKFTFPNFKITFKEIDRIYSEEMFQCIAEGTGVSIEQVWQTSLLSDEGYAFTLRQQGGSDWIFPSVNISGKSSKGLAYCPQCLASDQDPYYRKSWRYIFNPICPEHKVLLNQGCPACKKPYLYYKPFDESVRADTFTTCIHCGSDIRHSKSTETLPDLLDRAFEVQAELNEGLLRDSFVVPDFGQVHALPYFNVLHFLMHSLTNPELAAWVSHQYNSYLPQGLKIKGRDWAFSVNSIEELPTEDIAILLCLGSLLLEDWPDRFLELATKKKVLSLSIFMRENLAYWVAETAGNKLRIKGYHPVKEEIENARALLQSKLGRKASKNELKEFMSDGTVKSQLRLSKVKQREVELSPSNFKLGDPKPKRYHIHKNPDDLRKLISLDAEEIKKNYRLTKSENDSIQLKQNQQDLFDE